MFHYFSKFDSRFIKCEVLSKFELWNSQKESLRGYVLSLRVHFLTFYLY